MLGLLVNKFIFDVLESYKVCEKVHKLFEYLNHFIGFVTRYVTQSGLKAVKVHQQKN